MSTTAVARLSPLEAWVGWLLASVKRLASPGRSPPRLGEGAADSELLERLRLEGPQRDIAFGDLVAAHQQWLLHFLTCLLTNPHDAQDVAQEVFLRAYLAIDRFRGECAFRTWLTRIAINQAYNHSRKRRAEPSDRVIVLGARDDRGHLAERDAVTKALQQLSHIYREVLVLRFIADLDVSEIAEQLGIGQSAAKMRIQRARGEFKLRYERVSKGHRP